MATLAPTLYLDMYMRRCCTDIRVPIIVMHLEHVDAILPSYLQSAAEWGVTCSMSVDQIPD